MTLAQARIWQQIFEEPRPYQVQYRGKDGLTHLSQHVYGYSDAEVRMRAGFSVDVLNVWPVTECQGPCEVRFQ